jgi:hypothetical protein
MKLMSESLAEVAGSVHRPGLRRVLAILATALFLMLVNGTRTSSVAAQISGLRRQSQLIPLAQQSYSLPTTTLQAQSPQRAGGANTCRCLPPIPSEASATGACTRTQDDGTFCELTFSLSQRAAAVSQSPTFDKYAMDSKISIPADRIGSFVDRLQEDEIVDLKPEDVAASIQAVAAIAAFQRPSDTNTQRHFRDIFQMLTFQGSADRNRKAPVLQSMEHFAARPQGGRPEFEKVLAPSGGTYELVTTPGCIAFGESQFTFMVRATGVATPCERPR